MSDVLEFTYLGGMIGTLGQRIFCPECGEMTMLTVVADAAEVGDEPSWVRCPFGHAWYDPGVPRGAVSCLIVGVAAEDPETWQGFLHVLRERGHLIVGSYAIRKL